MNKLIKKSPINFIIIFFIFFIIAGWFYLGWPRFFNFLPEVKEVKADIIPEENNVSKDVGDLDDEGSSPSWPHTVDSNNAILIVGVAIDSRGASDVINSITYNGSPLTQLALNVNELSATVELWYLINPDVGSHTIIMNTGGTEQYAAGAMNFTGVYTSNPFGTYELNDGGSGAPSISGVSSAANELVLDIIAVDRDEGVTPGAGQTEIYVAEDGAIACAVSSKPGAALVDFSWSGVNDDWSIIAVPLKPAISFTGTGFDVHGWAWNDNAGWISLNCENTGVCITDSNYGVKIEDNFNFTGNLTGCAWSETIGWICFDPVDPPPGSPNHSAQIDFISKEISGWARVCQDASNPDNCSGSNPEGWIKMRNYPTDPGPDYGVYLDAANEFHGYAYNENYGWFSFTSKNCDPDGDGESNGGGECPPLGTLMGSYSVGLVTNVTGWAYSENFGWISFNCANPEVKECGNGFYGVNISYASSTFAGYARSDNLGWISFQESDVPDSDFDFSDNCDEPQDCKAGSNCTACYNSSDGQIYGWAKVLSMGNDGWIKMRKEPLDSGPDYGIYIEEITGDFHDWAWGQGTGETGVGWVSFNSENCDPDGDGFSNGVGACPVAGTPIPDYKVNYNEYITFNQLPEAQNLTAPNMSLTAACDPLLGALRAWLGWEFIDSDTDAFGTAYQIVLEEEDGTPVFDTVKCTDQYICDGCTDPSKCKIDPDCMVSSGSTCTFPLDSAELDYNTSYKWWVRVWDDRHAFSDLTPYDSPTDELFEVDDGKDLTFTTFRHEFPDPYFTWFPEEPSAEEEILFISRNLAQYYPYPDGKTPVECNDANCDWWWECIPPEVCDPDPQNASSTYVTFGLGEDRTIQLRVTHDTYFCSTSTNLDVKLRLPSWIEIK